MGKKKDTSEVEKLKKELEERNKQIEDFRNRMKYLQADFENYEKRIAKEKEELKRSAKEPLILRFLCVYEDLERALRNGSKGDKEALLKGVEMTYQQLKKALEEEGVTEIKAVGEKFDPYKHEALMNEEKKDFDEGTVLEEFQKGYMLKDKVIRYSKVKVSKR